VLIGTIERVLAQYDKQGSECERRQEYRTLVATLSAREAKVFELIVGGYLKQADCLCTWYLRPQVKVHRHRVMEKLGVRSVAQVVSIAASVGCRRKPDDPNVQATSP
jgi:FixJ family two-component response regulator